MSNTSSKDWARLEAALDELIVLPPAQRPAALARLSAGDTAFGTELSALAARLDAKATLFDRPAFEVLQPAANAQGEAHALPQNGRLGPWRIVELIGRGGMGEVFRAERADGQFEQRVAIKLLRPDAVPLLARFQVERQILARLEHPGIARLIDGDVDPNGRPYMVMELVEGRSLDDWCADARHDLDSRLALFLDICDAVAFAHRNLVVHRDLKPANVRVTLDSRPKLLDFGIARLLEGPTGDATMELMLTPSYAAPEQLSGDVITTAADVYALGLLLYKLLCGRDAHPVTHSSLTAAMRRMLGSAPSPPSRVVQELATWPVPARALAGDLDAIVARALRVEPEQRYASADAMRADIERYRQHRPVLARQGNWRYVAGRSLRRHRTVAAASAVVVLVVATGTVAVAWQANIARREAERATMVKNFLLQVFKASDPRIASDKPRGQTTARDLLDVGAERIERDFGAQPELRIELLGTVVGLLRELGETSRYKALQDRRLALAQQYPGKFPGAEVEIWLNRSRDEATNGGSRAARADLVPANRLLTLNGLDETLLRARWWVSFGEAVDQSAFAMRTAAFDHALALYARLGPHDPGRVTALTEQALVRFDAGDNLAAVRLDREALAAYETTIDRDDGEAQTIWGNLALAYVNLGRYAEAEAAYGRAADLVQRTYGKHSSYYWYPASQHARLLHLNGQRLQAIRQFEALMAFVPLTLEAPDAIEATANYTECLIRQGDAAKALSRAEAVEVAYQNHPSAAQSLRRFQLQLAGAYEQLGRFDDARRMFRVAFDEFVANERPEFQTRMAATERWARFLVARGENSAARALFAAVLAQDNSRHLAHTALAQAGLARVALAQGDLVVARAAIDDAMHRWATVRGFRDVRMGVYIARVHARVLLANGDRVGARREALAALVASEQYDAPAAPSIADAKELLALAGARAVPTR